MKVIEMRIIDIDINNIEVPDYIHHHIVAPDDQFVEVLIGGKPRVVNIRPFLEQTNYYEALEDSSDFVDFNGPINPDLDIIQQAKKGLGILKREN